VISDAERTKVVQLDRNSHRAERLPYLIEVWDPERSEVEEVLARAAGITLARAIFKAACEEMPDRLIRLRHGTRIVAQRS
jgi:hypothetical protein